MNAVVDSLPPPSSPSSPPSPSASAIHFPRHFQIPFKEIFRLVPVMSKEMTKDETLKYFQFQRKKTNQSQPTRLKMH